MALTSLASVKAQGNIASTDTTRDLQIRSLIEGVTSLVIQRLNRNLELTNYTEYYSGNGTPFLLLRQYPVTSVSLVCVDDGGYFGSAPDAFNASLNLVQGVDYALMSGAAGFGSTGILRRIGTTWHRIPSRAVGIIENLPGIPNGNIKVQYSAGFAVIPGAITMAVNAAVLKLLSTTMAGGGVASMSYEDASLNYLGPSDASQLFGAIESTLAQFRSIPV